MSSNSRDDALKRGVRWLAILPGALLLAWAAYILSIVAAAFANSRIGLDPDGFLLRVHKEMVSHLLMGAAFVVGGAYIAPLHRKNVAYTLAAIGFVLVGVSLFAALLQGDRWALFGALAMAVGLAIGVQHVIKKLG